MRKWFTLSIKFQNINAKYWKLAINIDSMYSIRDFQKELKLFKNLIKIDKIYDKNTFKFLFDIEKSL